MLAYSQTDLEVFFRALEVLKLSKTFQNDPIHTTINKRYDVSLVFWDFLLILKGALHLRSDSVSTIGVLKDLISREATTMKIQMSMNVDIKEETLPLQRKTLQNRSHMAACCNGGASFPSCPSKGTQF